MPEHSNINEDENDSVRLEFDEYLDESDKAHKILIDDKVELIPKSHSRIYPKKKVIYISEWLAFKKGLI